MFLKEFDFSIEMQKMKRKFNNNLINYGLVGEERVAYELKKLEQYIISLYNIRLKINNINIQIDYIVITNNYIYIIEVKNLLGNLLITEENEIIRRVYYNNIYKETSMQNPFIQMKNHKTMLEIYLKGINVNRQVETILVMANDKMIIDNKSKHKNIIKYDKIEEYIKHRESLKVYNEESLAIGNQILKKDNQYNYFMLNIIKKNIRNQYMPQFDNYYDLELYLKLLKLRKELSKKYNVPICNIFNNKSAEELVMKKPKCKGDFIKIKGFKETKYEMFGEEIINIFKKYC